MNIYTTFTVPGILTIGMMLFGILLGINGKPYSNAIFTIHKLFALAFVVVTIIKLMPYLKLTPINGLILILLVLAGLSIIGLFATGAAMSIIESSKPILLWLHRILPLTALCSLIVLLELLKTRL